MKKVDLLPAYIAGVPPFAWGQSDCCTVAADWLVALGHPDPMADLRGQYTTARQALRHINQRDLVELVRERLGEPMSNPLYAQRGDIAVIDFPNGRQAVGIVVGEDVVGPSSSGMLRAPLVDAIAAWRVG